MIITNKYGLPDTIVSAVQNDPYDRGDARWSATQLIAPVRKTILTERYWDLIEEDVIDRYWALLGKAAHRVLEDARIENALKEERLYWEVDGVRLSASLDLYEGSHNRLTDYKLTSVTSAKTGSRIPEWTEQLNVNGYAYRLHGFRADSYRVVAMYRDWLRRSFMRSVESDGAYYPLPMESIDLEVWSQDEQLDWIRGRVHKLLDASVLPDAELPECTPDEMWEDPPVFAVMKAGLKRASVLTGTAAEAQDWIEAQTKEKREMRIEARPGERKRCADYCSVAPHCSQYQTYLAERKSPETMMLEASLEMLSSNKTTEEAPI